MSLLLTRILPYLGYPLFLGMIFLWFGQRDDIARQVEICNQQKLVAVADAERIVREALAASHAIEIAEKDAQIERGRKAVALADMARDDAVAVADGAQEKIREMMKDVEDAETTTIDRACLIIDVPDDALDGLR